MRCCQDLQNNNVTSKKEVFTVLVALEILHIHLWYELSKETVPSKLSDSSRVTVFLVRRIKYECERGSW